MACVGWVRQHEGNGQDLADFPNLKRWFETLSHTAGVIRGFEVGREETRAAETSVGRQGRQAILFGQRAR